ncbi:MAG TPA: thioredoxin domain-containing protein [Candidatus Sulfotelmatobacter sp.]|nr:thioredoxin domain-containing protein [Candidatus Sulfotelmatobacter sp.]
MTTTTLNSLARASSAYLRSAMHQPIRWHEWGEEAFASAQRDNKPMLLDIGAVWCHWCHVMDRESYEDPEVAAIVNEHFIAVKVDRDERPDIDIRYQAAVSAVSGQGGWPLTAFLTPDGKPFYGGTYFPPTDGYGRPSFRRVLLSIANAYKEKNGDVLEQVKMVENAIAQAESFAGRSGRISPGIIAAIQESALKMFDPEHGGFGQAPKFPHPSVLDLLIEQFARTKDEGLRNLIVSTLEHMANGGVYDQLAGGFHRYSVDERWVVPHFEKMCYDNSELLKNYVHAYQATGSEFFANVARDIIRWMDEWLSDRERGGFYASQDADINMDDDGDYFTWTLDETRAVLTEEESQVAALHYDINEVGEMHHNPAKNVLYVRASIDEIARRMKLSAERVKELLDSAKKKMYAARLRRPTPYIDKTVYVGWNSMCVSAYLEAAKVLNLADTRRFALRSLDRILAEAWKAHAGSASAHVSQPRLLHVVAYSDPEAGHREVPGMLEDYAATALACLDAYEATADLSYFKFAHAIADAMIARFFDPVSGGFFDAEPAADGKSLGVLATRRKPLQDSPTPAGNPMAAIALLRLHHYTGDAAYRDKAEQTLETFAGVAGQFGIFAATYGIAAVHFLENPIQVVVVCENDADDAGSTLAAAANASFAFNKSALRLTANQAVAKNLPAALASTIPNLPELKSGKAFAVLCSGFTCQPPTRNAQELRRALELAVNRKS